MNNYIVYMHIFPNGKRYIGITNQTPERRWRNNGDGYKYAQKLIWYAIRKYGWENVKHEILYQNLSKEEACQKEIELIAEYNTTNREHGYNYHIGGELGPSGKKASEETRKKISESLKGNQYRKGKHFTEEQLIKLREVRAKQDYSHLKGRKMPEAFRERQRQKWLGKNNPNFNNGLSEEAKAKRKASLKGRVGPNKGKHLSEETKAKMSAIRKGRTPWNKGKPWSEETKKRISEAKKQKFQERRENNEN